MRRLLSLVMIAAPLPAAAQDFDCRNTAAETQCGAHGCKLEAEAFTPMQLSRRGTTLSICAYSGCWEGPVLVRRTRDGIDLLYAKVRGTAPGGAQSLAVIYDRAGGVAQMRWGGYANAMSCG